MTSKIVRVEIGDSGLPIRIFRNKEWLGCPEERLREMTKAEAVLGIRKQVFRRCWNSETGFFECEKCGRVITWSTGEMNEKLPKGAGGGKTGGEVSLENCEALCHQCHQGSPDSAHGNRRWQTTKLKPNEGPDGN